MFDKVEIHGNETQEEKDIAAYKFLLEAVMYSKEAPDSLKEEAKEEYMLHFGFKEHLEEASKIVDNWPEWKKKAIQGLR
jgi:hypothetical protein